MVAGPSEPLQREPPSKESILMMDYATTRARSTRALPPPHRQGGLAEAIVARAMISSPPHTVDEVDRLYHQMTETHAIDAVQLAECTHVDVSYASPQAHGLVNVALHREYPLGIVFIFS
jgi:hypothetical protein